MFFRIELVNIKFDDVPIESALQIRNKLTDTTVSSKISAEHVHLPVLFCTPRVEMSRQTQDARSLNIATVEIHIAKQPVEQIKLPCLATFLPLQIRSMTNVLIRTLWLTMQHVSHFVCTRLLVLVLFRLCFTVLQSAVAHVQTVSSRIDSTCCTIVQRNISSPSNQNAQLNNEKKHSNLHAITE